MDEQRVKKFPRDTKLINVGIEGTLKNTNGSARVIVIENRH